MRRSSTLSHCLGLLFIIQALLIAPAATQPQDKVRMCYFNNAAQDRAGNARFLPTDIDASLCTHILYDYASISADGTAIGISRSNDEEFYQQVMNLKNTNPSLKVLLSVGRAGLSTSNAFSTMVNDAVKRTQFIASTVVYLRQFGFDGLDVQWRFPRDADRTAYQNFITALWEFYKREGDTNAKGRLLITVPALGASGKVQAHYNPLEIESYVDYFLVSTYDLWGAGRSKLGHHTALYVRSQDVGDPDLDQSVNKTITEWLTLGVNRSKIVLGLATYGRTTRLTSPDLYHLGDTHSRTLATPGPYVGDKFLLSYYEICEKLRTADWNSSFVMPTTGSIAYSRVSPYDWVCYDNTLTFQLKANYALANGLAGVFFTDLDYDDFRGSFCGQSTYPLLRAVKQTFDTFFTTNVPPTAPTTTTPTTTIPTTTTPTTTTSTATATAVITTPGSGTRDCRPFRCPDALSAGNPYHLFADPYDCNRYYQCVMPGATSLYYSMPCPAGLVFDTSALRCEYPSVSPCVPCPTP